MTAIERVLEWLVANSGGVLARPGPADEDQLDALVEAGAPDDLVALYRGVGTDVPGLFVSSARDALLELVPPSACEGEDLGWVFATDDRSALAMRADGAIVDDGGPVAPDLASWAEAHLAWLAGGGLAWDPDLESHAFASAPSVLTEAAARVTGHADALAIWTSELRDDLVAVAARGHDAAAVALPGIGELRIHVLPERPAKHPRTGAPMVVPSVTVPAFRAGPWVKWRLIGEGSEPPRADPVAIRGLPLADAQGVALAVALGDALTTELLAGRAVRWSGLGTVRVEQKQAFDPVTRKRGATVRVALFTGSPSLKRVLNAR